MTQVHFIGIGGSGLSAIARLFLENGYIVTGSDLVMSSFAGELQKAGATIHIGHHPRNVSGADWVVRSSAILDDNPEVKAALTAGIPVYKRADFLGKLMGDKIGIAVAGTHGKTTTTAMITWILTQLGQDPSFILGSVVTNLGVNAHAGKGDVFVIEADEYDRMFLGLKPRIEIVTNIEHDHPDCYPTFDDMFSAFEEFVRLLPADGTLITCADDRGSASLISQARASRTNVLTYSAREELTLESPMWLSAREMKTNSSGGYSFKLASNLIGIPNGTETALQVPGIHNVRNALAALGTVGLLGLSVDDAVSALKDFKGASRRFEIRGQVKDVIVIDDYAHHPTEIRATLQAARARYPQQRIWAIWQPHTYSRTKALFTEFSQSFEDADEVIVSEIYASREPVQEYSSAKVVKAMSRTSAHFIPTLQGISKYLIDHLHAGDVMLVLSAGDAEQISADVLTKLKER